MTDVPHSISSFLKQEKLFTLSTSCNNISHSAICYYAYDEARTSLVFCSEARTKHIQFALCNPSVSGTILSHGNGFTKGLQFSGSLFSANEGQHPEAASLYYRKYPVALTMRGTIWIISISEMKMTDNKIAFRKKIEWLANTVNDERQKAF